MKKRALIVFVITILSISAVQYVFGLSTGITGLSGMNGGNSCNLCHYDGITPEVSMSGPQIVLPGATHIYSLTISGGQEISGGLNVAVTNGALLSLSSETRMENDEITHTAPKSVNQNGDVVFSYAWTAPNITGTVPITMYGAGNSVNGNGNNSGDAAGLTTLSITVMELNEKLYLPMIRQ